VLTIFEFTNYRIYLREWIGTQGEHSYGLKGRLAGKLGISSSLMSQILKGEKSLTPDQTSDLADTMALTEIESDYLHLLVDHDRAGNLKYRDKLMRKMKLLQAQSRQVGKRVPRHIELSDQQKAIYYSSWIYTGVRNLTAIEEMGTVGAIAEHLHLDSAIVTRVIRFLIENGLCKEAGGQITYGPASTHVDNDSPFVNKHHQNWRFQSIGKMENKNEDDLFFTSPMSLSRAAVLEIRTLLPAVIQNVMKISGPSKSEVTACLNIDWFQF
jgi:uncharacterized protein (TIGR02147 family)